jgi:hypothetical protein
MFKKKIKRLKEMKAFVELEYELVDDTCAPKQTIEEYKTNLLRKIDNLDSEIDHEERMLPLTILMYASCISFILLVIYFSLIKT